MMRGRVLTALIAAIGCVGVAAADIEINQEHRFEARPGAGLLVDVSFHSVEVTVRPGTTVDVAVEIEVKGSGSRSKNAANDLQPQFIDEGGRLIVRSTRSGGWSWKSVSAKGKVSIQMPPGMDLTIDSSSGGARVTGDLGDAVVRFDASSGGLTVEGAMRELHCDISSGSVRATLDRPVDVFTADASSGSVNLSGGAGKARVDTSSGGIALEGLRGDADLDASSGSISAEWDAIPSGATVRAGASSGSVTLRFPAGTTLRGSVNVSSGGIHTDFPGSMSKDHLKLNGGPGAVDIQVETSSGSVKLLKN
jgi:hypothetical protein